MPVDGLGELDAHGGVPYYISLVLTYKMSEIYYSFHIGSECRMPDMASGYLMSDVEIKVQETEQNIAVQEVRDYTVRTEGERKKRVHDNC